MTDLTAVPGNPEPLATAPTKLIFATCQAVFGCHPDKQLPVRAGQIVALQGMVEAVRKLLALSQMPEDTDPEQAQAEMAMIEAELRTWQVGFDDELRREMHPRPRLLVPDPPLLVTP